MYKANSIQHGGKHYGGHDWQHWDFVADARLGYFEGCATKYLLRWREKNGAEDLAKSIHFIQKLIELVKGGKVYSNLDRGADVLRNSELLYKLKEVYNVPDAEHLAIRLLTIWHDADDLAHALAIVSRLRAGAIAAEPTAAYVEQD